MRKTFLSAIMILLLVSTGYCQGQTQPLELTIKADKSVYEVGEEIKLIVTFTNKSNKEQIIFWNDENPASASGGGGTSLIKSISLKADAVYIKPKEADNKIINVGKAGMAGPAFTLTYDDSRVILNFESNSHQEIFIGTLTSNTITINVK